MKPDERARNRQRAKSGVGTLNLCSIVVPARDFALASACRNRDGRQVISAAAGGAAKVERQVVALRAWEKPVSSARVWETELVAVSAPTAELVSAAVRVSVAELRRVSVQVSLRKSAGERIVIWWARARPRVWAEQLQDDSRPGAAAFFWARASRFRWNGRVAARVGKAVAVPSTTSGHEARASKKTSPPRASGDASRCRVLRRIW